MKSINELVKEVHENAIAHGWWEQERSFGELIALCHAELSEALEESRAGYEPNESYYLCAEINIEVSNICNPKDQYDCLNYNKKEECPHRNQKPEGIPSELADTVIRIMDMCGHYGIDLEAAIAEKMSFNATRPYKHGGKVF